MNAFPVAGTPILAVFAAAAVAQPGPPPGEPIATQTIHRCIGPDGTPEFTGRPCATRSNPARLQPDSGPVPAATAPGTCPTSDDDLKSRVAAAVERHDVNALAGLVIWSGGAVHSRMGELSALVDGVPLGIEFDAGGAAGDGAEAGTESLVVTTNDSVHGVQREVTFGVVDRSGCRWLVW